MSDSPRPTRGQQRVLFLCNRANRRLRGERRADGETVYTVVELSETPPPREVMRVHARMIAQLLAAGWIEVAESNGQAWQYRVTSAGTSAEHAPVQDD